MAIYLRFQLFFKKILFIYFFTEKGREGERERNIEVRGEHPLVASRMHHNWGLNLQPRLVP